MKHAYRRYVAAHRYTYYAPGLRNWFYRKLMRLLNQ